MRRPEVRTKKDLDAAAVHLHVTRLLPGCDGELAFNAVRMEFVVLADDVAAGVDDYAAVHGTCPASVVMGAPDNPNVEPSRQALHTGDVTASIEVSADELGQD
jgi:hypothetical protein